VTYDDFYRAVEERANAATAGPWKSYREAIAHGSNIPSGNAFITHGHAGEEISFIEVVDGGYRDAPFIAAARTDVPALVARCRALEEALAFYAENEFWNASGFKDGKRFERSSIDRARAVLAAPAPEGK
jgi:hypothetical protein